MTRAVIASIILNDQTRTDLSAYGFRSWMIQDCSQPYEVIVNLFNDRRAVFDELSRDKNENCRLIINQFEPAGVFNISAANNLGLHFATGTYVMFANADIIHLRDFLRTITCEMAGKNLHYVVGTRCNLTPKRTATLAPAATYNAGNSFDFLRGVEFLKENPNGYGLSPWMISRQAIRAIGAFDPRVYCHEDEDLNDRAMHYLRRQGQQQVLFCVFNQLGYHLHHKPSELQPMGPASMKVILPRRKRLTADPNSTEDIVSTPLDSLDELRTIMQQSAKPEIPLSKTLREILPLPIRMALKRSKMAAHILLKGHL